MSIILWISLIMLITGIILVIFIEAAEGPGIFAIIISLAGGFMLLGNIVPVETELIKVPVKSYCSTEIGECRIIIPGGDSFTLTKYSEVKTLSENPPDSIHIRYHYNSYGGKLNTEILLK